jgi:hypothetical protein
MRSGSERESCIALYTSKSPVKNTIGGSEVALALALSVTENTFDISASAAGPEDAIIIRFPNRSVGEPVGIPFVILGHRTIVFSHHLFHTSGFSHER